MQENSDTYIAKWQLDASKFLNDDLRHSSIDRQAAVKQHFTDVTKAYAQLEAEYRPFITTLTEIEAALANDLTAASVDSVKPVSAKAVTDGGKVQMQIDEVIRQLDALIGSLSSSAPAPRP